MQNLNSKPLSLNLNAKCIHNLNIHPKPKLFENVHKKRSYQRCNLFKLSQRKWWEKNHRTCAQQAQTPTTRLCSSCYQNSTLYVDNGVYSSNCKIVL